MKNDNVLVKHHFWLLLGVVPLFAFIGVLIVNSKVGGRIEDRKKEIKTANDQIGSKQNPKSAKLIAEADTTVRKVDLRQGSLHKENSDRQRYKYDPDNKRFLYDKPYLYTWPSNSQLLKKYEQADLKFGALLANTGGEFDEFSKGEVYLAEFSTAKKGVPGAGTGMADTVAPTQFNGGWANVLRHVNTWDGVALTKDQVWLLMEDIWVQRSMLDAVRSVNEEMSAFRRAKREANGDVVVDESFDEKGAKRGQDRDGKSLPTPDAEKLKATFRNRTWAVDLEVVKDGNIQVITGSLTNISDRLQLMGSGNMMVVKVFFAGQAVPRFIQIGGEFLPGRGAKKIVKTDGVEREVAANVLPFVRNKSHELDVTVTEIVRIEQVFDVRTVPIKRIDALVIGHPRALDSRSAAAQLVPPTFMPEAPPPADAGGAGGAGGPPAGMGGISPMGSGGGPPPMGVGGGPPPAGAGGTSSGQATKGKAAGGGTVAEVLDGNKKRYLQANAQVRRMPVGIVVVVDQAYMQDVLMAFANSPLRFQITQVEWTRFYGTLAGTGPGTSPSNPNDYVDFGGGSSNIKGSGDPDAGMRPPGKGSGGGPPPMPGGGATTPPGPGPMGGPPPGMGGLPSGFGQPTSGSSSSGVSESQITSGLVELSIYGVISLYEKYEAPKADGGTTPAPGPAPAPPGPGPAPGPTGMPPKMRRRARATR